FDLAQVQATHASDGVYEVNLPIKRAGAYYVYVSVPSRKISYGDLRYLTLMAVAPQDVAASMAVQQGVSK
ncbi:MAG: hypothetical protein MUP61_03705, partial [Burkholderiales bacterium]|nr:hypothetical protein [Burkholderiales bacterium]